MLAFGRTLIYVVEIEIEIEIEKAPGDGRKGEYFSAIPCSGWALY